MIRSRLNFGRYGSARTPLEGDMTETKAFLQTRVARIGRGRSFPRGSVSGVTSRGHMISLNKLLLILCIAVGVPSFAFGQRPLPITQLDTAGFDRSVRPQDYFFSFVNGGWIKHTVIPADMSRLDYADLERRTASVLHNLVDEAAKSHAPRGSPRQLVGDFYATLLDSVSIEDAGARPLAGFLEEIDRFRTMGDLSGIFARLGSFGVNRPILAVVIQDPKHANEYAMTLRQWGLYLPNRALYLGSDSNSVRIRGEYVRHIRAMLTKAGIANPSEEATRVIGLETMLANAHWSLARNRDPIATYNKLTVAQLQSLTPRFDWTSHFKALGVPSVAAVIVRQPSYVAAVDTILGHTTIADWKSYLRFHVVAAAAAGNALSLAFMTEYLDFNRRVLYGVPEAGPRWKLALSATEESLGDALGRLYVEHEFPPARRARAETLVHSMVEAFRFGIDELDWMSDSTKARAKGKLDQISLKIGYPDRWKDYSGLTVRRGDAVGNAFRAAKFWYDEQFARLGKPVATDAWFTTPQTINAFYNPRRNDIVLPAANFQPPVFDDRADDALNFAAIGGIVGHELSHAFDEQGRLSDGDGSLRDWWTAADANAFQQRADRLAEQYNSYSPLAGAFVNGRNTLGENIADLGGLAIAYKAYRMTLHGREAPLIDGLTGDQRFFLAFAQARRSVTREQTVRTELLSDTHAPAMYRVNGVLMNFDPFYAAWNVKPGDKMYLSPAERVRIW